VGHSSSLNNRSEFLLFHQPTFTSKMVSAIFNILALLCATSALAKPLVKRTAGYDVNAYEGLGPDNANCYRQTYQVDVTSNNYVFTNVDSNANETVLTKLLQTFVGDLGNANGNFTSKYLNGGAKKNVTATYGISGILCTPKKSNGKPSTTVQLLVHGIGFDSSYYNFVGQDISEGYSYVRTAAEHGYTTFRYDRLGTGLSEHPKDAYNTVQGPTDLAILTEITSMLRAGKIGGTSFETIVGVGHSYGSVQLNALTAASPSAVNHVILTGFSANTSAVPLYLTSTAYSTATNVFPDRFSSKDLTNAYLVTLAPQTNQLNFFYYPYYTNAANTRARQTEQPVTQGVLFTFGMLPGPAPSFNGKVHVVTGSNDWIFCLNNCYAVPVGSGKASLLDYVGSMLYPAASAFSTSIPANTGHAQFQHLSAPQSIEEIQEWLDANL